MIASLHISPFALRTRFHLRVPLDTHLTRTYPTYTVLPLSSFCPPAVKPSCPYSLLHSHERHLRISGELERETKGHAKNRESLAYNRNQLLSLFTSKRTPARERFNLHTHKSTPIRRQPINPLPWNRRLMRGVQRRGSYAYLASRPPKASPTVSVRDHPCGNRVEATRGEEEDAGNNECPFASATSNNERTTIACPSRNPKIVSLIVC